VSDGSVNGMRGGSASVLVDGRDAPASAAPPRFVPRPGTIPTLPVPDASAWRSLHLVGVGGAGMRNIARLLMARGVSVAGSDLKDSANLRRLRDAGATVFAGHHADQVGSPDAVVVSSAVPTSNPEVRRAEELGIPVLTRAQVLAALTRGHRLIAVGGTHGKTTTTSMIAVMLQRAGLAPTFVIGGDLNESGSGAEAGEGDLFVVEADESDGTFLLLRPEIAVLTNVEPDHLDFFRDRADIESGFATWAEPAHTVIACWDDPGVRRTVADRPGVFRYGDHREAGRDGHGLGDGGLDVTITDVVCEPLASHAVFEHAGRRVEVHLKVPGRHNVPNAAAAVSAGLAVGLDLETAVAGVEAFSGVHRRFERRGIARGATFVDDYAHHPTEVAAALSVARAARPDGRVVAVCQPHRFTRMQLMWRDLGESLVDSDMAVITDVYDAHEQPIPGITGKLVVSALAEAAPGHRIVYLPNRSDLIEFLAREVGPGDLVVTLGCGDINLIIPPTIARIEELEAARR
jgi:UDP-N-acetylmuramate--alanine ligase